MTDKFIGYIFNNKMKKFRLVLVANSKKQYNILEIWNENNICLDGIFLDSFQKSHPFYSEIALKLYIDKVINK